MALKCSPAVRQKLSDKHGVSLEEVRECFANRVGGLLEDAREDHRTDPHMAPIREKRPFMRSLRFDRAESETYQ